MKKVLSIALVGALSHIAFAQPSAQQDNQANEQIQQNANIAQAIPAKKDESAFKDFMKQTKLSGFAFARFFTINGYDNINQNGQSQQYRMKLDVTSGKVHGFSATAGIFFAQGSSTPDMGDTTNGAVQGGRGTAFINGFSDRFNVSQLFASKEFEVGGFGAKIDAGKINISSPLNDNKVDMGTGIVANAKHSLGDMGSLKYHASFYDSWSGDHVGYNIRRRSPKQGTTDLKDQNAAGIGIGNNLTLVGVGGDLLNKALSVNVYAGNIWNLMDFVFYGEAKYGMKLGDTTKLTFLAQTSMAALSANPRLYLGYGTKSVTSNFDSELLNNAAKFRGIYNLQAKLAINKFALKAGYLGSFGDGYGTLLDYKGSIDTAGKIWNGSITATYEGLGMLGSGGFKNTSINVAYMAAEYGFKIPLKVGIDVAYVFGNTNMPALKVTAPNKTITHSTIGTQQFIWQANFVEITPSISYKFFDKLELSFFGAMLLGDLDFFKTRTELKYTF